MKGPLVSYYALVKVYGKLTKVLWRTDLTEEICEEGLLGLSKSRGGSVACFVILQPRV